MLAQADQFGTQMVKVLTGRPRSESGEYPEPSPYELDDHERSTSLA
jgi:hypothetical protein